MHFMDHSPNMPTPRGAHSASLIGQKIYIFGGYGGTGYGRRDFNDMYELDINDFSWNRVHGKGGGKVISVPPHFPL